ncbi:MAG TPA: hypothetical protein VGM07_18080 [Stellaceae bacterium]
MKASSIGAAMAVSLALFTIYARHSRSAAQTASEPAWTLNEQKTTVVAKFPTVPPATLTLDAAQVDKMIAELAQLRAAMKPPRPIGDPAPGTTINVATTGRWWVQPDGAGIDLAILHPGYGWVGLELNQTAIEQLNRRLIRAIHRPPERARHVYQRRYEHR